MLEIKNLTALRSGKTILQGAELTLGERGIVALIGKNGCGKSTLCDCINGALPFVGEILYDGKSLSRIRARERAKLISFLPQRIPCPHITVSELALFGRSPYRAFFAEDRSGSGIIARTMQMLGIAELSERFLDELSGGELRRAYLAMTLARETPYIILDEPCAHMDAAFTHSFMQSLIQIKREKSLLIVMHDINAAVRYADRIAILDGGKIVFSGDACASYEAIEAVFGIKKYISGENVFFAP